MENQKKIFIEWERLLRNVRDFNSESSAYYHNAPYALQKCNDLLNFMKQEKNSLREWCNRYLKENRQEIYVKFWIMMGWNIINEHNNGLNNLRFLPKVNKLHSDFFSYAEKLGVKCEYDVAINSIKEIHYIHEPHHCNIFEILKNHEGKECISNGWYCDYCEDMEDSWHRYLVKKVRDTLTTNIFINKEARDIFIKGTSEKCLAPETWIPPFPIQDEIVEPILLQISGQTSAQLMKEVVEFASWQIQIWNYNYKTDFERFCELWKFLEVLDSKLEVLEDALKEISQRI